jgi:16S rRNA G966 N2-methylase RsmD
LFTSEFQTFVRQHAESDVLKLALQAHLYPNIDIKLAIQQIQGRQKAKFKLPSFYDNENIVYPLGLSIEQCSSELAANFKANLFLNSPKKLLIDLTGGFGIDSYYFSRIFENVIYVEQQEYLANIAKHNFDALQTDTQAHNITSYHGNSIEFLQKLDNYDEIIDATISNIKITKQETCIYLDPARRDKNQQKVVSLADCEPNIIEILPLLWQKSDTILLKTSPMLDIKMAVSQLNCSVEIIIVAVENECKEVLYKLSSQVSDNSDKKNIELHTFNLHPTKLTQFFSFSETEEQNAKVNYHKPLQYLYEPNVAILKSGGFKVLGEKLNLYKLHSNSHLYTSENFVENFVGRSFQIIQVCKFDKKEILKFLPHAKANVSVRNFPITVEEFRKKTGIKDGGEFYIFATTDCENNKIVIITKQIL